MKYKKKPIIVEAFKWTGGYEGEDPVWACDAVKRGDIRFESAGSVDVIMYIQTLEGVMKARPGDYIIQGINGEIYPCKPDIFEKTYEAIEEK